MNVVVMRVGIICFQHESNTWSARPTGMDEFQEVILTRGPAMEENYRGSFHEVAGFYETLREEGLEPVGILSAKAKPQGKVTAETYDAIWKMIAEEMQKAGDLDGLLVAPHGAGVAENHPDMDGSWLTEVRAHYGPDLPIVCTLDPHANLSEAMIASCNATIAYQCNPHTDHKERGVEAARLMARTLRGEVKPVQAGAFPPMAINIERQLTRAEPCQGLIRVADDIRSRPGVLSVSILLGFPYADVAEMGTAFTVVTDNDREAAKKHVSELVDYLYHHREEFRGQMISIPEALEKAAASPKPVCLLDMGDNSGGGAPSDGTLLAKAILDSGNLRGFVALRDPDCVQQANQAGVGAELDLQMGGKTDDQHGSPLEARVRVVRLTDGTYQDPEPRHGGHTRYNQGPTAVVETLDGGLTIMLTTRKSGSSSPYQLYSCDLKPEQFDVMVAKGVHAPVAGYVDICPTMIRVNTPGVTAADMERFVYEHRRRPMFPFEDLSVEEWNGSTRHVRGA